MKVEQTKVTKLRLTEIEGLDPVSVIIEDLGPRQGKVVIDCYGQAWSAYWGGIGDNSVAEFVNRCNNPYLIGYFAPSLRSTKPDYDNIDKWFKTEILQLRKDRDIDTDEARELWDDVELWCENDEQFLQSERGSQMAHKIVGDDWWHSIPEAVNHDYTYLDRIVTALKEAVSTLIVDKAA